MSGAETTPDSETEEDDYRDAVGEKGIRTLARTSKAAAPLPVSNTLNGLISISSI